jgi:hypothetical protein
MNIYYLQVTKEVSRYDEATSMVVVAKSHQGARKIASQNHGDEGPGVWLNWRESVVMSLGELYPPRERFFSTGLVCRDYRGG